MARLELDLLRESRSLKKRRSRVERTRGNTRIIGGAFSASGVAGLIAALSGSGSALEFLLALGAAALGGGAFLWGAGTFLTGLQLDDIDSHEDELDDNLAEVRWVKRELEGGRKMLESSSASSAELPGPEDPEGE